MKTIETLPNRLTRATAVDAAPLLDVIIGHRLRGKLVEWDHDTLKNASTDRLSIFLMCGEQLLYPVGEKYLPLEAIQSSERQNPNGFYLHSITDPNGWSAPQKGVYHTVATPHAKTSYTIGLYGSMLDLQSAQTQSWLHTIVESIHNDLRNMDDSLGRILLELSEPGFVAFLSNPEGLIVTANSLACEIMGKNPIEIVGTEYQTMLHEPDIKSKLGKNRLTSVAFGDKSYTLISLATKTETSAQTRHYESITFLFQLLRDKVAVCDIASDFLVDALASPIDNAPEEVAQTLARELHDLRQYVERAEMLAHNKWNITNRQNLCALVTIAADKSRALFPSHHDIRSLPFEGNIYHNCCAQGIDITLETVLWLHLHEQNCQTHTTMCLTQGDHIQIDITTTPLSDCLLHQPKSGWMTYLKHLGQELNLRIETVQHSATSAITTYIEFVNIKE